MHQDFSTHFPRRSSMGTCISPSRVVTDFKNQNSCSAELGARAYVSIGVPPSCRLGLITRSNLHSSLCFRRVVCWFSYTQLFLSLGAGVLKEVVSSALWQLQRCASPIVACNQRRNHPITFLVTRFVLILDQFTCILLPHLLGQGSRKIDSLRWLES